MSMSFTADRLTVKIFPTTRKQTGAGETQFRTVGTYLSIPDKLK